MKILPCPFCGGEAKGYRFSRSAFTLIYDYEIECTQCSANSGTKDTEEEAIEAWNTRVGGEDEK